MEGGRFAEHVRIYVNVRVNTFISTCTNAIIAGSTRRQKKHSGCRGGGVFDRV